MSNETLLAVKLLLISFLVKISNCYILHDHLNEIGFSNVTGFAEPFHGNIPDSLDWRNHTAVTGVRNQGRCAACWAFSIVGCIESQVLIKYKQSVDLSEQMLIDCANNGGCRSGSLVKGFAHLVKELGGVVSEKDYPYTDKPQSGECRDHDKMRKISVLGFSRVAPDEEQMRQYVARVGPLAVAINPKSMQTYPENGWIDMPRPQDCKPDELNHTVLIVGYGTYITDGARVPYWIIKNSWGTEWGYKGFYYLQRGQNACGIASDIVYGIIA